MSRRLARQPAALALCLAAFLLPGPADAAADRQDFIACAGDEVAAAEAACGRIIAAGKLPRAHLAEIHYSRGISRFMAENFAGAAEDFSRALELRADYAEALVYRALARQGAGELDGAIEDYTRALETVDAGERDDVRYRRALAHAAREDWRAAAADYAALTESRKDDPDAWYRLGDARERAGDLTGAHAAYERAAEAGQGSEAAQARATAIAPRVAVLEAGVALADWDDCMRAGDQREAACTRVIDAQQGLAPASLARAHFHRAYARESAGDADGALADYDAVLAATPDHAAARYNRAALHLTRGDEHAAADDYDALVRADPGHWQARLQRALLHLAHEDFRSAIRDLDAVIDARADDAAAYLQRGVALQSEGDEAGAMRDFDAAIERDPALVQARYNRAALRQRRGDLAGALADYDAAIEQRPDYAAALNNRGVVRQSQGELEAARADYQAAAEADPGFERARENLANIEILIEQRERAGAGST